MKKISLKPIKEHANRIKDDLVADRLNGIEWIVLSCILLLVLVTLFYGDNLGMFLTYYWNTEGLFKSGNLSFLGNNRLPYGIVQQWFCVIWTLPVNIVSRFVDFEIANTVTVIWFKLSMAFIFTLCMSEMVKVGRLLEISRERIKWMLILFCSTILVALPVFHIAQSDILYAYISLLGIRAFLNKDTKKFVLFFAMAISCKAIAVLIFIPLVLLREKRLLYILRDTVLGGSIFVIERIWYKVVDKLNALITGKHVQNTIQVKTVVDDAEVMVEKSLDQVNIDFFSHFYHKMLFFEFPAIRKGYMAAVLVVLLVLLYIWCYVQKKDNDHWKHNGIYAVAVAWLLFFINASPSPYWIVTMFPAWFLLIFMQPERLKINLLLENVFALTMFLVYVVNTNWVYGGPSNLDYLLLKGLLKEGHDSVNGPFVARYLNNLGIESVMNVITGICLAVSIALIVINNRKVKVDDELTANDEKKIMHGFAIWQISVLGLWYVINVLVVQRW
ncbi:MAG: hypothetical protein K5662_05425 [Lachnospiraceae bacterium]|nr:hypothetical protein [Lachnospiraceae bacterium]